MTISGNLKTMHLAEILQWVAGGLHTGTLVITQGALEKKVYFREGVILSSTSSDPTSFLGHFLVSKGIVTEDQLAQAMAIQAERGGLLGEIFVQGGAMDSETLDEMLRRSAEENILDLFRWEEGEFSFLKGDLPDRDLVAMNVDVTGLVLEGTRRIDELAQIRELIPSSQCVPVAVAPLLDEKELDLGWQGVLEAVDDDRSIEDICLHTHSSEYFVSQVLYGAVTEGKLKIVRPRIVPAEPDPATAANDETDEPPLTRAESLVAEALDHLRAGAHETAARHLQAAVKLEPNNRELLNSARELEYEIRFSLETDGIASAVVPFLETSLDDLRSLSFSPEEGFILSRINGTSDIASIMKISPLSELDSMLVFWKLAQSGHIRLENAS